IYGAILRSALRQWGTDEESPEALRDEAAVARAHVGLDVDERLAAVTDRAPCDDRALLHRRDVVHLDLDRDAGLSLLERLHDRARHARVDEREDGASVEDADRVEVRRLHLERDLGSARD